MPVQWSRFHSSQQDQISKTSARKWVSKSEAQKVPLIISFTNADSLFSGVDSASTGGTWDISNADRLGKSEVDLVNIFISGLSKIIKWEQALEEGQNIDEEIAAL